MIVLTHELIEAGANVKSWNSQQLALLGVVDYPPKRGWKEALIGKEISEEDYEKFLALRGSPEAREHDRQMANKRAREKKRQAKHG